jgi:phosphomannomutase
VQVIDVGMVTTPQLYFAAHTLCQSGIQITGSHNPRDYNGFKMVLAGKAIYGAEIQALREMMQSASWVLQNGGGCSQHDVLPAYSGSIVGDIRLDRPLKIVVDSGNGIAGASAPGILRAIGCEVEIIIEPGTNRRSSRARSTPSRGCSQFPHDGIAQFLRPISRDHPFARAHPVA